MEGYLDKDGNMVIYRLNEEGELMAVNQTCCYREKMCGDDCPQFHDPVTKQELKNAAGEYRQLRVLYICQGRELRFTKFKIKKEW